MTLIEEIEALAALQKKCQIGSHTYDGAHSILAECYGGIGKAIALIESQQAKIDALMFEYCPEEMTEAQIKEYEQSQVSTNDSDLLKTSKEQE